MRVRPFAILMLMALTVALAPLPVSAGPISFPYALADGEWRGFATGNATFRGEQAGLTFTWSGSLTVATKFDVSDGLSDGEFQMTGIAIQLIQDPAGYTTEISREYSGGGVATGTDAVIFLDGTVASTGTILAADGNLSWPTDTSDPFFVAMDISEVCDVAYGDWHGALAEYFAIANMESVGASSAAFIAFPKGEKLSGNAGAILEAAGYSPSQRFMDGTPADTPVVLSQLHTFLLDFADLMARFPDWTYTDTAAHIDEANRIINRLQNLDACEEAVLGADNVERWITMLTVNVRTMITGLLDLNLFSPRDDLSSLRGPAVRIPSAEWQMLVNIAVRTGAVGRGAFDEEAAGIAENNLRAIGSAILEASLDADGELQANDHVMRVLATGAALGWSFTVGDSSIDAADAWGELFG